MKINTNKINFKTSKTQILVNSNLEVLINKFQILIPVLI